MIALDQAGSALTEARRMRPPPELARWVVDAWADRVCKPRWKIVADDAPHLIYSETETRGGVVRRRLALVGPRSVALEIDQSRRRLTVAVRLRAGSLLPLFGVSGTELVDRSVSVALLSVGAARAAEGVERTAEAADPGPLFDLLAERVRRASSLGGRATRPDWRIAALPDPRGTEGAPVRSGIPLSNFCRDLGVSPRTLRQCFAEHVGLAPSRVARIRRLHRALLEGLQAPRGRPWSRIASGAGYADQSHLIRDCRDLMGETPERFRARR